MPATFFLRPAACFLRLLAAVAGICGGWPLAACAEKSSGPVNVVLVHGIYDQGRIFDSMVRELEQQGCRCLAPSLSPNDGSGGIRVLTQKLAREIDARFGPSAPIFIIGFSMGGVVTRDYVQNLATHGRVRGVFFISTPHHGTLWASMARGRTRELGYHSEFIETLNRDERAWRGIPVCSYWTPCDLMIFPATNCRWSVGETREIFCLLHPWMVRNRRLVADVTARIAVLTKGEGSARQRAAIGHAAGAASLASVK